MVDLSEEESHAENHMEGDGGEMITGSGVGFFVPSTSANNSEDGVSDLVVLINLSNLIQVPKPSDRFTVTIDHSLINVQSVVPTSISNTCIKFM